MSVEAPTQNPPATRHLLFGLGPHVFSVSLAQVREVRELGAATPLPGTGPEVLGLVNVRGTLVPAIDLGRLLELPAARRAVDPALLVLEDARRRLLGVCVARLAGLAAADEIGDELARQPADVSGPVRGVRAVREWAGKSALFELDVDALYAAVFP